jgi:D-alanyl-D-alanine carboxypeptidase (penicillin-binding protein 5/6)
MEMIELRYDGKMVCFMAVIYSAVMGLVFSPMGSLATAGVPFRISVGALAEASAGISAGGISTEAAAGRVLAEAAVGGASAEAAVGGASAEAAVGRASAEAAVGGASAEAAASKSSDTSSTGKILAGTSTGVLDAGVDPPAINAVAAVVVEESTGRILYEKNALAKRSIASTTKIMTALVALENANVEDVVVISKRAASIGGSVAHLRQGERYTLKELLYALLLTSANDAAIAIAEHVGGSVEGFAVMMNKRARTLGAVNSNFVTPHGLDRENQYSTAYDVALITIEALKHPLFREIVSTASSYIPGRNLYNTNELLGAYPGADGVKTGYTGKAGRCLVTTAKRNDMRLISVVLGSPTRSARAEASRKLLDYGFDNFSMYKLMSKGEAYVKIPVYRGIAEYVALKADKDIVLPLSRKEAEALTVREHVPDIVDAPVYAGSVSGYVEFVLDGRVLAQNMLTVGEDIRKTNYLDYLGLIINTWGRLMRGGIFTSL